MDSENAGKLRPAAESRSLMLEHDPHICFLLDEDCRALDCNAEAVAFFGKRSKEETCKYITEDIATGKKEMYDPTKPPLRERFRIARELGHCSFDTTLYINDRDTSVEVVMKRLPGEDSFAVAVYMEDITDRLESGALMAAHSEMLQAVNTMAGLLQAAEPIQIVDTVNKSLDGFLKLLDADKADIYETQPDSGKTALLHLHSRTSRFFRSSGQKQFDGVSVSDISERLYDLLRNGQIINGPMRELPIEDQRRARQYGIRSILMIPIIHEGRFWGYVCFEDCRRERYFSGSEEQTMRSAAVLLASALIRNKMTESLRQAKQELMAQDYLLRGVNEVAALLLGNYQYDFMRTVRQSLMVLGNAVNGDRVSIWRNRKSADGELISERFTGWILGRPIDEDDLTYSIPLLKYVPQWGGVRRVAMHVNRSEMNRYLQSMPILDYSGTLLLIPLDIRGEFWGFAGISRREENHAFPPPQVNLLRSGSMMIVSAIKREEDKQDLIDAREKALARSARQKAFLAHISREVRTPLNSITGMTAVARQSPNAVDYAHYLSSVDESSRRILAAVNSLLAGVEPEEKGSVKPQYQPLDFRAFLQNVYEAARLTTDRRRQTLTFTQPKENDYYMITDELRLRQLLDNLLENASKFTPVGGSVSLKADIVPGDTVADGQKATLRIEVSDTGIGITEEQQNVLFKTPGDKDYSGSSPAGVPGYGLLLCRDIVESMEGGIRVSSTPGEGSCFTVHLRFEWGHPMKERGAVQELVPDNAGRYTRNWSRFRILLAEDVDINAEVIAAMLANTGVSIETARDGQQAILAYQAAPESYNLIIMDVHMPIMDGIKVARLIRSSSLPGSRTIPIIAVTAGAFESDSQDTARAGFDRHLSKPADIDELFETLDYYFTREENKTRL